MPSRIPDEAPGASPGSRRPSRDTPARGIRSLFTATNRCLSIATLLRFSITVRLPAAYPPVGAVGPASSFLSADRQAGLIQVDIPNLGRICAWRTYQTTTAASRRKISITVTSKVLHENVGCGPIVFMFGCARLRVRGLQAHVSSSRSFPGRGRSRVFPVPPPGAPGGRPVRFRTVLSGNCFAHSGKAVNECLQGAYFI